VTLLLGQCVQRTEKFAGFRLMSLPGRHAVCLDVGNFIERGPVTPYLRATLLTDKQIVHNGKQPSPRAHVIAQRVEAIESVYQAIMHQIVPFLRVPYVAN
jgi:hypothetical protein